MVPSGMVSAEEPDRVRGLKRGFSWLDEAAFMPLIIEVWSNLVLALRVGENPKILVTTTPRQLNGSRDLSRTPDHYSQGFHLREPPQPLPVFRDQVLAKFEGTRLGRQELYGEVLEDVEELTLEPEMIQARQRI